MERVLVVDDDLVILDLVARVLSRGGFEVVTAHDVTQALSQLQAANVQLVVSDLELGPCGSAHDVYEQLSAIQKRRFLVISGSGGDGEPRPFAAQMRAEGRWLDKPFDPDKLLERVRQL